MIFRKFCKNMFQTIGKYNFFRTDDGVVSRDLLKSFFGDFDVRSFALHQDFRNGFFGDQKINSLCSTVEFKLFFEDQGGKISVFFEMKIMYPMLPNPFFRREQKPAFPYQIINKKLIFVSLDLKIKSILKIQFRKLHL